MANPQIPLLADAPGRFSLYTDPRLEHREVEMELTLKGRAIVLRGLQEQVEDKTARLVKQVYQRHSSKRHLEPQRQLL